MCNKQDINQIDRAFKYLYNSGEEEYYYNGIEYFWQDLLGDLKSNPIIGHFVCHMALNTIKKGDCIGNLEYLLKWFDCSYYVDSMIELIINKSRYTDMLVKCILDTRTVREYDIIEKSKYLIFTKLNSIGHSDDNVYRMVDVFYFDKQSSEDEYTTTLIKCLAHIEYNVKYLED